MKKHYTKRWKQELAMAMAATLAVGSVPVSAMAADVKKQVTIQKAAELPDPVHWYKFDETDPLVDFGTKQTDGTILENVEYAEGKSGNAQAEDYYQNFAETENVDNWVIAGKNGKKALEDGMLSLEQYNVNDDTAKAVFCDSASPVSEDGYVETVIVPQPMQKDEGSRMGILFRVQSFDTYAAISYEWWNGWEYQAGNDGEWKKLGVDIPKLEANKETKVRVEYEGAHIKLFADDKLIYEGDIPALDIGAGQIGARMWGETRYGHAGHAHFKYFKAGALKEAIASTVSPENVEIDVAEWEKQDVSVSMTLGEGDSLEEVKNGDAVLTAGTDYMVDGTTVTIKKEYLASAEESVTLSFVFAKGSTDDVTITKIIPEAEVEYFNDFKDIDGLVKKSGNGSYKLDENGELRINGETVLIDTKSPALKNGEVEITLEPMNDRGGFGLVFRADGNNWTGFQCVDTRRSAFVYAGWNLKNNAGANDMIWDDTTLPMSMREYKFKLRVEGNVATFYVDGEEAYTFESGRLSEMAGQIGIMTMGQTDVKIKNISCRSLEKLKVNEAAEAENVVLKSEKMDVTLDGAFPRVLEYNYDGKKMYGQVEPKYYAMVNSVNYPATAEVVKTAENSVTYRVTVEEAGVSFDTVYTVDGAALTMNIENINERNTRVYTLGFPENCILSVKNSQQDAKLDAAIPWKPLNNSTVDDVKDAHYDLSKAISGNGYKYATIPIFTADGVSASAINTLVKNLQEFAFKSFTAKDGTVYTGVWNTEFVHRGWGFDDDKYAKPNEDLSCTVVLTKDANDDKTVDWQDGALALNTVRDLLPGSDILADSFVHIAMNFASGAQQPFLRIGDNLKKVYLNTDGFGQMLEIKGYNSEGHDSGHSEASNVNMRAGGAKDYQTLAEEALKYNAYVGGHVNVSNMFPEASTWDPRYAGADNHTWGGWLDNGCDIKRENFIEDGLMDEEFNKLAEAVPDIGLVYLDTFVDYRYSSYRIGENFKSHNWAVWNENKAMLDKYCSWVHWPGVSSTIHRFVHHQDKDVYGGNNLLWGGARTNGFMSWQHTNDFNSVIKHFFTEQLPYRYLMNHELLDLNANDAVFANGVRSTSDKKIYKDDKLVVNGNGKIFVPWFAEDSETKNPDEADKIYHWNTNGGQTTWELPDSWAGQSEVKLYRLTDTGKVDEKIVAVVDGKVTLDVKSNTPYVVYKGDDTKNHVEVEEWSTGSPVKDASFISHGFDNWTKSADTEDIVVEHTGFDKCYLAMNGADDNAVSQNIKLEAGKKYELSVWAEVSGGKQAVLEVELADGTVVSNHMDASPLVNGDLNAAMKNTYFLRMPVTFTATGDGSATVTLKGVGGAADGFAHFADVRVVETKRPDLKNGYILNEDFENVSEGWGPFFPTGRNIEKIHLSETNAPYTDDTLDGKWSLKCKGNGMRTLPYTLRFEPNTTYMIEFLSSGGGSIKVRCDSSSEELLNASIKSGKNKFQVTTGDAKDYYIQLDSPQIIDNFVVKEFVINKAALEELMEEAKTSYVETDYTAEQWSTFQKEIVKAQVVLDKDHSTQEDIENAFSALKKAMSDLANSGGVAGGRDLPIDGMMVTAGNEEPDHGSEGPVKYVLDNNASTFWHSDWGGDTLNNLWLDIELAEATTVGGVRVLSRSGGGNGTIEKAEIWVKTADAEDYVKVVDNAVLGKGWSMATFEQIDNVTNVRIQPLQTEGGNKYASAAEVRIMGGIEETEPSAVDKTGLQAAVDAAKALVKADYTADSWAVVEAKLAAAQAVLENAEATDYEVLLATANLEDAMELLVEAEETDVDKADLEALITYAQAQKENAAYDFVVPAVKNAFEEALTKAVEVNEKAATQAEVDKAYDRLLKMVQMLDFTGNNMKLEELVGYANGLKKELYTAATWKVFEAACTDAQRVLDDENSLQAEIDDARVVLRNAIFGLRLIPDKGQLEDLIKNAEAVDTANYTVKSATAFAKALDHAKAVFADGDATEEEVKAAEKALEEAQKNLVAKVDTDAGKEDSKSAAKTGDTSQTAGKVAMLMAAAIAVLTLKRKREH